MSAPFSLRDGQDVAGLRIVLAPSATIAGTVRDAQGAVVPGARVWLRDWNFDTNRQMSGNVVEVLTDRQGRYRFVDVVPGGHYLEIVEGPVGRRAQTEPFEVEPGKTLQFDLTAP